MATKEQMDRVTKEIEALQENWSFVPLDDKRVILTSHGRGTDDGFYYWTELSENHRQDALSAVIDWTGFAETQRADVIKRVLDGQEPDFWMDGIDQDEPAKQKELIADFHARVEELKREGVPDFPPLGGKLPWDQATEERKFQNIVWESMSVWLGEKDTINVPEEVTLAVIEQNLDFTKLPEEIRESLGRIRAHEGIGAELQRIARFEYDDELPELPQDQTRPVRPLTEQLITAVLLDIWPGNAAIIDFGIDSDRHLGALQFAVKFGEVTPQELDAAMGNGAKLTEIVQRGENPYRDVVFKTSWDKLRIEQEDLPSTPPESPESQKADSPKLTGKAELERLLFGGKAPEPKQPEKSKERGIEI